MKTFSQCDYVNRLERLLGLIRITICLCNYTLSTGNLGHYPIAPRALDLHKSRRSRAEVWENSGQPPEEPPGSNWNWKEQFFFSRDTFIPWIPNVSFSGDIFSAGLPWWCTKVRLSSPTGLLPMALSLAPALRCCWQVPVKLGYSLLVLIKSVRQVSLLI